MDTLIDAVRCLPPMVEAVNAELARARADADGKENVIKELTCIIVEKDRRIAELLSRSSKRMPWWRHIIPKGM